MFLSGVFLFSLSISEKHEIILVCLARVRDGDGHQKWESGALLQGAHWSREFLGAVLGKSKSSRAGVQSRETHCPMDSDTSLRCGSEFALKCES